MQVSESELKTFILDSGLVSRKDVEAAELRSREFMQFGSDSGEKSAVSLGDVLVSEGLLSSDALRRIKSYVLGIPFVNLKDAKVTFEILSLIPEPISRTHNIVAFKRQGDALEVAMLDTEDLPAIDLVRKKIGLTIMPRLTDDDSIKHALMQYQKSLKEEFGDVISKESGNIKFLRDVSSNEMSPEELRRMAEDLPIVRIVDTLLRHAIIQGASDIHIEQMEEEVLVRYRIDGILHDAMTLPKQAGAGITARIKVLASLKLDERSLPQDGRFKMETEGDKVSFRVSILPTYFGEKIVMRLLRETGEGFTLEALGFHGASLERVHDAMKQTSGIILIAGPADSGKTTSLYTILDILNTPNVSISTIEDPIEYQMKRVNQTQVNSAIGFSYANGLRALLRQDPNIVMVGEIRDNETASLAVNAALTGHLVLSTIHTNSAADAIPRLIDMGIEPFLLASTLRAVLGERLVRRLAGSKDQYALTEEERSKISTEENFNAVLKALLAEKLVKPGTKAKDLGFYRPKKGTSIEDGYQSRIGIHEILPVSSAIKELILRSASKESIETQAKKEGMLTLLEDGLYQASRGVTSLEEVVRATRD
jgi:type IV pilus assembly protein PilB